MIYFKRVPTSLSSYISDPASKKGCRAKMSPRAEFTLVQNSRRKKCPRAEVTLTQKLYLVYNQTVSKYEN